MPLDTHSYLRSQGWSGQGTALRAKDALSKPLTIPQKRTLAGVGKDRDEAFPFWDHVFSAAAKTIQIKLYNDDDDDEPDSDSTPKPVALATTKTGILSNRRPTSGTPASGSSTPVVPSGSVRNVLAEAKREAAKQGLYARFYKGPVIWDEEEKILEKLQVEVRMGAEVVLEAGDSSAHKGQGDDSEVATEKKRRKAEKQERKRRREEKRVRREAKAKKKEDKKESKKRRSEDEAVEDEPKVGTGVTQTNRSEPTLQPEASAVLDDTVVAIIEVDRKEKRERKKRKKHMVD